MHKEIKYFLLLSIVFSYNIEKSSASNRNPEAKKVDSLAEKINTNSGFKQVELTSSIINYMENYYSANTNMLDDNDFNNFAYLISFYNQDKAKREYYLNKLRRIENLGAKDKLLLEYWENYNNYYSQEYHSALQGFTSITCDKSFDSLNNFKPKSYIFIANSYEGLSNFSAAENNYEKALNQITDNKGLYLNTIQDLSICYYKQNKITQAISTINRGNILFARNTKNPEFSLWNVNFLQLKAFYYRELALNNCDSLNLLAKSLNDNDQSIQIANRFVQKLHFESDQLEFNHNYNSLFYKGIEASLRLNRALGHDSLLQKALYYSELDKSLTLIRHFNKQKALKEQSVSAPKLEEIDRLYIQLENLEASIYNEKAQFNPDEKSLLDFYLQKEQLLNEANDMEYALEEEFPRYKKQRQTMPILDTNFIFDLSYQKQIIEFQISDENIYSFLINNGKIHHHVAAYNEEFASKLTQYRSLIADANYIDYSDEQFTQFVTLSHELYNYLIEPLAEHMDKKSLLIIPDNELHLIPFETLLNKAYTSNEVDYASLPYLLKDFDISYANSLFILQHQMAKPQLMSETKLLSYAPSYKNLPGNEGSQYLALRDARDGLGSLPGAQNEVRLIKKQVQSMALFDDKASEEHFKKTAGLYPIIHCAMHTLIDNENPQFSKLVFTPDTDTKEDGLLHTYELNRMSILSEMVVLSACNTAFGHVSKGEGLMNLSRGFTKAGCKSVLSTLWSVSDASSASVMDNFYKELVQEQNKSYSLSKAKRNYLNSNSGTLAHPFYWSGYVLSGNDRPVQIKAPKNYAKYLLITASLFILSLIFIFIRKRKRGHAYAQIS